MRAQGWRSDPGFQESHALRSLPGRRHGLLGPCLCALACLVPGLAPAQDGVFDLQGFGWKTGGFASASAGDTLNVVATSANLDARFGVDTRLAEVTLWVTDLVHTGRVDRFGGWQLHWFSGGTFALWVDTRRNHDFGANPPNSTVPTTFEDGALLLGGEVGDFLLGFQPQTGHGVFEALLLFTSGSALDVLFQLPSTLFTLVGEVAAPPAASGSVPSGYDVQVQGGVLGVRLEAVESRSWTAVKNLYRAR